MKQENLYKFDVIDVNYFDYKGTMPMHSKKNGTKTFNKLISQIQATGDEIMETQKLLTEYVNDKFVFDTKKKYIREDPLTEEMEKLKIHENYNLEQDSYNKFTKVNNMVGIPCTNYEKHLDTKNIDFYQPVKRHNYSNYDKNKHYFTKNLSSNLNYLHSFKTDINDVIYKGERDYKNQKRSKSVMPQVRMQSDEEDANPKRYGTKKPSEVVYDIDESFNQLSYLVSQRKHYVEKSESDSMSVSIPEKNSNAQKVKIYDALKKKYVHHYLKEQKKLFTSKYSNIEQIQHKLTKKMNDSNMSPKQNQIRAQTKSYVLFNKQFESFENKKDDIEKYASKLYEKNKPMQVFIPKEKVKNNLDFCGFVKDIISGKGRATSRNIINLKNADRLDQIDIGLSDIKVLDAVNQELQDIKL